MQDEHTITAIAQTNQRPCRRTPDPSADSRNGENAFFVSLCVSPEQTDAVIRFFERVAAEERWEPSGDLRGLGDRSTYFGMWTGASKLKGSSCDSLSVAGGLQLVLPDVSGALPTHRIWPEIAPVDPQHSAHILMLAVAKQWRGRFGGLFWLLTAALWNYSVRAGICVLYLEATPKTLRGYEHVGWPLEVIGPLREHWSEPVYPCRMYVREVAGVLAERAVFSARYRRIMERAFGGSNGN